MQLKTSRVYYKCNLLTFMKIAFLGKGGSGKSTLSSKMCHYLVAKGYSVLAVDADHNMDLAFNLKPDFEGPYIGNSREDVLEHQGSFSLYPADAFTQKYTTDLTPYLKLMVSGPHTEDVLDGKRCSHSLSFSLKKYFPKLSLRQHEAVVVDEKAGSDGAGTGALKGFDHIFVISEPTPHGIKAAHQIADILEYYNLPHSFIGNKSTEEINTRKKPLWVFPHGPTDIQWEEGLEKIFSLLRS